MTAKLAIEGIIKEANKKHLDILIVGGSGKVQKHLEKFNIFDRIPEDHRISSRLEALQKAIVQLNPQTADVVRRDRHRSILCLSDFKPKYLLRSLPHAQTNLPRHL